jgi:hypothetical protein
VYNTNPQQTPQKAAKPELCNTQSFTTTDNTVLILGTPLWNVKRSRVRFAELHIERLFLQTSLRLDAGTAAQQSSFPQTVRVAQITQKS